MISKKIKSSSVDLATVKAHIFECTSAAWIFQKYQKY